MKKGLSAKITFIIISLLFLVISVMIFASYFISKTFYKDNLTSEVEHRITSHAFVIEEKFDLDTIHHVLMMEQREDVHLILFDEELTTVVKSHQIKDEWITEYQSWIEQQLTFVHDFPLVDHVHTGINFHIPHIWAVQPIFVDGEIKGYLFMDKDTGDFEATKVKLLVLLILMGGLTFLIGFLMTTYVTRKISKPLIEMGKITNQIAKGDFDHTPKINADDEVGQLSKDISLMAKQLKEYRDSRQQFISHISHDLRTPITYIKGYSAIMRDSKHIDETDWRRNTDVIYHEATRMEHLVRDLFQLTKLEEGQVRLEFEKVAVIPWINLILESRQLMFDQNSLTYEIVPSNDQIEVTMDQHRMGQAIINLLENSIRYTEKGGQITIKIEEQNEHITIEISDTGRGIPDEDLPNIWERFYRVDKSRSRQSGGSGLGLAIVKQVIELHKGTISVKSVVDQGTTFLIRLPKNH